MLGGNLEEAVHAIGFQRWDAHAGEKAQADRWLGQATAGIVRSREDDKKGYSCDASCLFFDTEAFSVTSGRKSWTRDKARLTNFARSVMWWFGRSKSDKYAGALLKVAANLAEVSTTDARSDHAPLVLKELRPDFKLRLLAFCLGTAYYFASVKESALDGDAQASLSEGLQEAWRVLVRLASSEENGGFFSAAVNRPYCISEAFQVLQGTTVGWSEYIDCLELSGRDRATEVLCRMLRAAESQNPPSQEDLRRLTPLARWFEDTVLSVGPSVESLTR